MAKTMIVDKVGNLNVSVATLTEQQSLNLQGARLLEGSLVIPFGEVLSVPFVELNYNAVKALIISPDGDVVLDYLAISQVVFSHYGKWEKGTDLPKLQTKESKSGHLVPDSELSQERQLRFKTTPISSGKNSAYTGYVETPYLYKVVRKDYFIFAEYGEDKNVLLNEDKTCKLRRKSKPVLSRIENLSDDTRKFLASKEVSNLIPDLKI